MDPDLRMVYHLDSYGALVRPTGPAVCAICRGPEWHQFVTCIHCRIMYHVGCMLPLYHCLSCVSEAADGP